MFNMKRLSATTLLALAAGPYFSAAAPLARTASGDSNVVVLQVAVVLEQLETEFYKEALSKFQANDFISAGFSSAQVPMEQVAVIAQDEATHTSVIQAALNSLGQTPLQCQFDFSSVLTDVKTMLSVARVVENVGVGAYLGAAHLLTDPTVLTAAASIVTVESRHHTMLNIFNNGQAISNAFDLPLLVNEVFSIAGGFIQGGDCGLGITPNVALTITTTEIQVGTVLGFQWAGMPSDLANSGLFCQLMSGGMAASEPLPISQCAIPQGMSGSVGVWITKDNNPLNNNARDRDTLSTVAGPSIFFVDIVVEEISVIIRNDPSSGSQLPPPPPPGEGPSSNDGSASQTPPPPPSAEGPSSSEGSAPPVPTLTIPPSQASSLVGEATNAPGPQPNPMIQMVPAPPASS